MAKTINYWLHWALLPQSLHPAQPLQMGSTTACPSQGWGQGGNVTNAQACSSCPWPSVAPIHGHLAVTHTNTDSGAGLYSQASQLLHTVCAVVIRGRRERRKEEKQEETGRVWGEEGGDPGQAQAVGRGERSRSEEGPGSRRGPRREAAATLRPQLPGAGSLGGRRRNGPVWGRGCQQDGAGRAGLGGAASILGVVGRDLPRG